MAGIMNVNGEPYRTIWLADDGHAVEIIDQTRLPHEFITVRLETMNDVATAIADMWVRGAPLIGATAAYGMALAMTEAASAADAQPRPAGCAAAGGGRNRRAERDSRRPRIGSVVCRGAE